jgi:hypothetical protein
VRDETQKVVGAEGRQGEVWLVLWHAVVKRGGATRTGGSKRGAEETLWFDVAGVI